MNVSRRIVHAGLSIGLSLVLLAYLSFVIDFRQAVEAFSGIPAAALWATVLLLTVSTMLGGLRLFVLLFDMRKPISIWVAAKAAFLSSIGGLAFFQVVGQTLTRVAILRSAGISVSATILATVYERIASTFILSLVAFFGAAYIFGGLSFSEDAGLYSLAAFVGSLVLAVVLGASFSYRDLARNLILPLVNKRALSGAARLTFLTIAVQGLTLVSFVILGAAVEPSVLVVDLFAASAIVMFAAAIPISFGGWGVRELGAVYAYGAIGISAPEAIVISVILGAISQLVLLLASGASLMSGKTKIVEGCDELGRSTTTMPLIQKEAWPEFIAIAVATLVLFQVRLPLAESSIVANLADLLAVVGLVFFAIAWARLDFRRSVWRLGATEIIILLATVVITIGVLIGWSRIGLTNWALFNRFFGWFVLVAYMSTGALMVVNGGVKGLGTIARAYVATMVAIVLVEMLIRLVISVYSPSAINTLGVRMEGFAGNPNALSFQILVAVIAIYAFSARRTFRNHYGYLLTLIGGILITGLWLSSSRAGFIAFGIVTLFAVGLRAISIRKTVEILAAGLIIAVAYEFLNANLASWLSSDGASIAGSNFQSRSIYEDSNDGLRVESLLGGLNLWLNHPIFGAGIGVFLQRRIEEFGVPLVIHNSPMWILAEMGLVGVLVFGAGLALIIKNAWGRRARPVERSQHVFFLILAAMMAVHAMFHDMFFQRTFWFFLGACLAVPAALVYYRRATQDHQPSILFVIGSLNRGGAETHVSGLVRRLQGRGLKPVIFCTGEQGPLAQSVRDQGIEVIAPRYRNSFFGRLRWVRALLLVFNSFRLINVMREREPTIVHFFLPEAYISGGFAALVARCPKRIMSRRSLNYYQKRRPLLAIVEKWLHPTMDVILGNSREVARQLREDEHILPQKLGLIFNGVNTLKYSPEAADISYRDTLGIPRASIVITIVANLIPYKGHGDLLAGLSSMKHILPKNWMLVIVGRDDGEGAVLRDLATETGLSDNLLFLGERVDTPEILGVSDIGLNTSHEEGFSNAVLEGMSSALPMVVTDVGGNPEAVVDGVTGYVVPPKSPVSLGAAIARLADNKGLRERLGNAGRARIVKEFSAEKCLESYMELYLKLAADKTDRPIPQSIRIDAPPMKKSTGMAQT